MTDDIENYSSEDCSSEEADSYDGADHGVVPVRFGAGYTIYAPAGNDSPNNTTVIYSKLSKDTWFVDKYGKVWRPLYLDHDVKHIRGFGGRSKLLAINAPNVLGACLLKNDTWEKNVSYAVIRDININCIEVTSIACPDIRFFAIENEKFAKESKKLKRKRRSLNKKLQKIQDKEFDLINRKIKLQDCFY